jgi:hypothetical protein
MIHHQTQPIGYSSRKYTGQKMNWDPAFSSKVVSGTGLTKAMHVAIMGIRE